MRGVVSEQLRVRAQYESCTHVKTLSMRLPWLKHCQSLASRSPTYPPCSCACAETGGRVRKSRLGVILGLGRFGGQRGVYIPSWQQFRKNCERPSVTSTHLESCATLIEACMETGHSSVGRAVDCSGSNTYINMSLVRFRLAGLFAPAWKCFSSPRLC